MPVPGQLLAASGIFAMLGLLSEAGAGASFLASTLAWGFDLAAFLNIAPSISTGGTTKGLSSGPQDKGAAPTQTGA